MLAGPDLLIILVIALIVFGPKKLPELAKSVGKMMGEFKKTGEEVKESIGIKELEGIRTNVTGVDLLVDLAEKTSEYMTPSDSNKDASLSKEEPICEKTLSLASASVGNGEKGTNEKFPSFLSDQNEPAGGCI
jgi:TatA/E family protein of Tat protein translocase